MLRRAPVFVAIVVALLVLVTVLSPSAADGDRGPAWYLPLVHNQVTPTPTCTVTPTPTPTATPTPLPAIVRIAPDCSQFDVPGADGKRYTEEYVCFENRGGATAYLEGWVVRDEADAQYTFPPFELAPQAVVRLRSGYGTDTATDLYWGQNRFVWNNAGDTVYLYDNVGNLVDRYAY